MKAISILLVGAFVLSGCAHSAMRGTVAMKTSDSEAHVCLGKGEVKAGDRVRLFANRCTPKGKGEGRDGSCEKVFLGTGSVQKLINEHYSVVKFDDGVEFEEGSFVERL